MSRNNSLITSAKRYFAIPGNSWHKFGIDKSTETQGSLGKSGGPGCVLPSWDSDVCGTVYYRQLPKSAHIVDDNVCTARGKRTYHGKGQENLTYWPHYLWKLLISPQKLSYYGACSSITLETWVDGFYNDWLAWASSELAILHSKRFSLESGVIFFCPGPRTKAQTQNSAMLISHCPGQLCGLCAPPQLAPTCSSWWKQALQPEAGGRQTQQ